MSTTDIGEYSDERPAQNERAANTSYYSEVSRWFIISMIGEQNNAPRVTAQSDRRQSHREVRQRQRCISYRHGCVDGYTPQIHCRIRLYSWLRTTLLPAFYMHRRMGIGMTAECANRIRSDRTLLNKHSVTLNVHLFHAWLRQFWCACYPVPIQSPWQRWACISVQRQSIFTHGQHEWTGHWMVVSAPPSQLWK